MAMMRKDFHEERYEYLNGKDMEHSKEELRRNWWYYHKYFVVAGILVVIALLDILRIVFHVGETLPDYQIAYVGIDLLPDDTVTQLQELFSSIAEDANGDGQIVVQINQYSLNTNGEEDTETASVDAETQFYLDYAASDDASYRYAATIQIIGDLEAYDSFLFLLEDPVTFLENFGGLSYLDGTAPDADATDLENMYMAWTDSPVLAASQLGDYRTAVMDSQISGSSDQLLSGLYLGRRAFRENKSCSYPEACEKLWSRIIDMAAVK